MAVLQKPRNVGEIGSKRNNSGKKLPFVLPKHQGPFKAWLNQEAAMDFVQFGLQTYAIPKDSMLHLEQLWSKLRIVKSGIRMGTLDKQQQLIPDHDLALSIHLSKDLPRWELNNDNALAYLRKQNLEVDGLQPKGWNLVSYAHLGLGFAKVMPGRMNNYLPSELRIIKASQE
jgi:NOL1/NOP2/fmu family ribosome biogenesis protein